MPLRRSKKFHRACGRGPRGTRAGHTSRGVVPGRDASRSEEQAPAGRLRNAGRARSGSPSYRWARKGSRPRAIYDQRTDSAYLFGAVCPERGAGAALVLPACNSEAMQLHLDEIATKVTPGAHAIVILDQAGWHGAKNLEVPRNISLLPLPPRSPELNSQETTFRS